MSDKNIDKDIERINNIIYCNDETRVHYIDISYSQSAYDDSDDCEKFVIAIENVLSELEKNKKSSR